MCAIFGSFDKETFFQLMELNSYRGSVSHSITCVGLNAVRGLGPFNPQLIEYVPNNVYLIGHVQAPTGKIKPTLNTTHPAEYKRRKLWHNGMLKADYHSRLNDTLKIHEQWDTMSMLQSIVYRGLVPTLNEVDGSFACVMMMPSNKVHIFRNESSPLFYDDKGNISSVKRDGLSEVTPNVIYEWDDKWKTKCKFDNTNKPYYFGV